MVDLLGSVNFDDQKRYLKEYNASRKEDLEELLEILRRQEDSRKVLEEEIRVIVSNNESLRRELKSSTEMMEYWKDQYEVCNSSLRLINEEFEQLKAHDENLNTFNKTFKSMECKRCGYEWKNIKVENDLSTGGEGVDNFLEVTNILVSSLFIKELEISRKREAKEEEDGPMSGGDQNRTRIQERDFELERLKIENKELKILLEKKESIILDLQNEIGEITGRLMIERSLPNIFKVVNVVKEARDEKEVSEDFGFEEDVKLSSEHKFS
ncbi:Low complexity protein with large Glu repeat, partial [Cryptosporidium felis]